MRTTQLYLSLGAFAGILAVVAWANQANVRDANAQEILETPVVSPQVETVVPETKTKHQAIKASEIIGMNVRGESGDDNIGSINDLMVHHDGKVSYAAVSFGGFLGVGDKLFAVPMEAIEFVRTDDDAYARINVNEEQLKQMEGFDQNNWPDMPNKAFLGDNSLRQAERPVADTATDTELER